MGALQQQQQLKDTCKLLSPGSYRLLFSWGKSTGFSAQKPAVSEWESQAFTWDWGAFLYFLEVNTSADIPPPIERCLKVGATWLGSNQLTDEGEDVGGSLTIGLLSSVSRRPWRPMDRRASMAVSDGMTWSLSLVTKLEWAMKFWLYLKSIF